MIAKLISLLVISLMIHGCGKFLDLRKDDNRSNFPAIEDGIYRGESEPCARRVKTFDSKLSVEKVEDNSNPGITCHSAGTAVVYTRTPSGAYLSDGIYSAELKLKSLITITSSSSFVEQPSGLAMTGQAFHRVSASNN